MFLQTTSLVYLEAEKNGTLEIIDIIYVPKGDNSRNTLTVPFSNNFSYQNCSN